MEVLKVSSKSSPNSVAGAMAGVVRQAGAVEVQVVGAGALNQAVKAVAIARGYLAPSGVDLVCVPTFADIEIEGQGRTAIRLLVEHRDRLRAAIAGTARVSVDVRDRTVASPSVVSGAREPMTVERALSAQPAD
jgi:stage V sporulation protein S